ncbi:MAG: amidohydrolase [Methanobacteriota archaeon]|nr:MAG: amidohydrolase [Euryarchaeota archaeon]TLZ66799.1 MAG: amidohydrolase [Euryarchaeota archaeon]
MARGADLVFVGGKIFTAARVRPWAKAMAIRDDRIVAVGTEVEAERWADRRTRRIDFHGRVVVPGFIDAHAHLADSAGELGWTRLNGTHSIEEALERLRKVAAQTAPGQWVIGIDWDEAKWTESRYPTREDLDRVSTEHPVVARRIDCHLGSVNSRALESARDLVGLRGFEVDGSGRPTGILKEDAFSELHDRFASPPAVIERNLPRMARMAHRLGITSIHDVVPISAWRAYQRAHRRGRFQLRVYAMVPGAATASLAQGGIQSGLGDEWLRVGAVKVFSDGSLGARTAALASPYETQVEERGMWIHPPSELWAILETAHQAGLQTATHAIGDAAVRLVSETLDGIEKENPRESLRHRIEHYELPDDDVLRRTKEAGLVASCQPNFIGQWSGPGDVYENRLGPIRTARNNPYRRIARLGIPLCFGSDGMPYGPLYGIHWAVNGYFEDQRLSPEEAFRAYTAGGAYASFEEHEKGTLGAGKLADFVILDGDPFRNPTAIDRCRVRETWMGGRRVFPASKS